MFDNLANNDSSKVPANEFNMIKKTTLHFKMPDCIQSKISVARVTVALHGKQFSNVGSGPHVESLDFKLRSPKKI